MARRRRSATARTRPEEFGAVYPHRWAIPRDVWTRFFESAEHEIGILAYSALFLAEDAGLLGILADKGRAASRSGSRSATPIAPASPNAARKKASAMPCPPRSATRLRSTVRFEVENVEIRLHQSRLVQLDLSR